MVTGDWGLRQIAEASRHLTAYNKRFESPHLLYSMMKHILLAGFVGVLLAASGCSNLAQQTSAPENEAVEPLVTGAIPDQDPEKLQRLYGQLTDYLEAQLGVPVEYKPVTDYAAAVTAFKVGDLDLVWFGGLTGVQARSQVPGAKAIAQRDIDAQFQSVFIANTDSDIGNIKLTEDFQQLRGQTFTFGSESSTSGRLMPQYFLKQANIGLEDFKGEVGFSGSHDKTIKLVEAGTYDVGALNAQVWESRVEAGEVDRDRVEVIWRSPPYYDYHWVLHPDTSDRYGEDFTQKVQQAFLNLDPSNPEHQEILSLFGANQFITTENSNYRTIEEIGREIGKIK